MKKKINFFLADNSEKKALKRRAFYIIIGLVFFILTFGGYYWHNYTLIQDLKGKIAENESYLVSDQIKPRLGEYNSINSKLEQLENALPEMEAIASRIDNLEIIRTSLIEKLILACPEEITLNNVTLNSQSFELQCSTSNLKSVATLKKNLLTINELQNIHIDFIQGSPENYKFNINGILK